MFFIVIVGFLYLFGLATDRIGNCYYDSTVMRFVALVIYLFCLLYMMTVRSVNGLLVTIFNYY